jgi:hypothetical protein
MLGKTLQILLMLLVVTTTTTTTTTIATTTTNNNNNKSFEYDNENPGSIKFAELDERFTK